MPSTPFRFVLHFVGLSRIWYVGMVAFETLNAACGMLVPYALHRIIDGVSHASERSEAVVTALRGPLLLFFAFVLGEVVFGRLTAAIQYRLGPRQRQHVTRSLFHYLQLHSHRFLSENFAGSLAHKISEAAAGVNQTLWTIITEFWPIAIALGVGVVLLFGAHAQLGLFALVWSLLFIALSFVLARRARPFAVRAAAARSETTGRVVDAVTNLATTRLFARHDFERELLEGVLAAELAAMRRSHGYSERVRWFQFSAAAILKLGVLYLALMQWARGAIEVGQFVMAVSLSLLIITEARNLARRFLEFFEYIGNVTNGVNAIVRAHDLVDGPEARARTIGAGRIEFRDVDFAYGDGRPIFRQLNLTIEPGQRVGLVGYSGSGKSTFVSLLLRLYDVQRGQILIDGHDVRSLTQDSLHEQIALIPQDPSLFHRSLRENISYGRPAASQPEIEEAARRAHAHDFISQIRGGYDALVGERGVKLSGGQRQRVAIARVILKDAPVLILDEATSSLDSVTEQAIQEALAREMVGKTVVVVAHRLSTIAHLDRILVFDDGQIVEDGTHAELLARRGAYHRLWSRQSDGFLPAGSAADAATEAAAPVASPGPADDDDEPPSGKPDGDEPRVRMTA